LKFKIENITTIKNQVYVFTRILDLNQNFKLSDTTLFGGVEIEKWLDIPIANDENGNQRKDNVAFVLKNADDQGKINLGDILELTDKYVSVIESAFTISGRIHCLLECNAGVLNIDTKLSDEKGQCWTVIENNLLFGRVQDTDLQKKIKDNNWYFYRLSPLANELVRPDANSKLKVS